MLLSAIASSNRLRKDNRRWVKGWQGGWECDALPVPRC